MGYLQADPMFDGLRADPRFKVCCGASASRSEMWLRRLLVEAKPLHSLLFA
jgi:hypothetical protein